jgi:hypothetical protein
MLGEWMLRLVIRRRFFLFSLGELLRGKQNRNALEWNISGHSRKIERN